MHVHWLLALLMVVAVAAFATLRRPAFSITLGVLVVVLYLAIPRF